MSWAKTAISEPSGGAAAGNIVHAAVKTSQQGVSSFALSTIRFEQRLRGESADDRLFPLEPGLYQITAHLIGNNDADTRCYALYEFNGERSSFHGGVTTPPNQRDSDRIFITMQAILEATVPGDLLFRFIHYNGNRESILMGSNVVVAKI